MSEPTGALLEQLLSLPPPARGDCVRAAGQPREVLIALADECERSTLSNVARAREASAMLVALADELNEPRARVRARRTRAQALAYSGEFLAALATVAEAISLGVDAGEPVEVARARLTSMHPLGELGRYDEALAAGDEARDAFLRHGEPTLAAYADVNLGIIRQNRDEPEAALAHFDRARAALVQEPVRIGWLENNRGEALLQLHRFDEAEQAFRASLAASEGASATLAAAIAEGNLADLAARRGVLRDALACFESARRRLERDAAGSHLARLLGEQAEAMEALGLIDDAIVAYRRVLPQLQEQGLRSELARAWLGVGRSLLRRNALDEAGPMLDAAAEEYDRLGNVAARAKVDLIRAELRLARGEVVFAEALLHEARPALGDRPADLGALLFGLARLAWSRGDSTAAEAHIADALALVEPLGLPPLSAELLHFRATLRRSQHRLAEAIRDLRSATALIERVRGMLQADRFRYAYLGDRLGVFADLVSCLLESPDVDAGGLLDAIEQARSRALLDALGESAADIPGAASDDTDATLLASAARMRMELNALYSQSYDAASSTDRARAAALREALGRRENELQAIEDRLSAGRRTRGGMARRVDLPGLQASLAPDQVLVEYFMTDDETIALAVTRNDAVVHRRLGSRREVEPLVDRLCFQIARATRPPLPNGAPPPRLLDDFLRESHALWRRLLRPMAPLLASHARCVVVPYGVLHRVPFHALWDGGQYLVERCDVSYAPSAALHLELAETPHAAAIMCGGSALAVGYGDRLAPQIVHEARAVADALPGATLLTGLDATADAVIAQAPRADVIHFACHGSYSIRHPLSSGLRLADRWLTVRDISAMRLCAELVTLSACETGRSLVHAGDELLGLIRAFFIAGARSVIASQWLLSDDSAAEMMSALYRAHYRTDAPRPSLAAALRGVQRSAMRRRAHPAFWAPLMLIGAS